MRRHPGRTSTWFDENDYFEFFPLQGVGKPATGWGRLIFYVVDVDAFWTYLKERGFDPEMWDWNVPSPFPIKMEIVLSLVFANRQIEFPVTVEIGGHD